MPQTNLDLRREAHDRVCRARAVARLVDSDDFTIAYTRAVSSDRAIASDLIRELNKDGLHDWIVAMLPAKDNSGKTLRELRIVGQRLGIRNYHMLPKAILLSEIAHATTAKAAR